MGLHTCTAVARSLCVSWAFLFTFVCWWCVQIECVERFVSTVNGALRQRDNQHQLVSLATARIESYDAIEAPNDECVKVRRYASPRSTASVCCKPARQRLLQKAILSRLCCCCEFVGGLRFSVDLLYSLLWICCTPRLSVLFNILTFSGVIYIYYEIVHEVHTNTSK